MPQYVFRCGRCNHTETVIRTMARRNDACPCPKCSTPPLEEGAILMERDITAEGCWSDNIDYLKPVFSESMGVHPRQVAKAQALHPHIKYQPDGTIRIDSPREYKEVRKALGMVDRRRR
jgi:putative FmdB family regulatory protein